METSQVTRVRVWSRWLRLSHWTITLAVTGLLFSGWLSSASPSLETDARDLHFLCSALLIPALLLRFYLLFFGRGTDHITDCEPNAHRLRQAAEVLRFYLTLGRAPLPKWFAHNPLWGPLYLLLFLFLTLSVASGLMLQKEIAFFANISLHDLHHISYLFVATFVPLHILAVFSHDANSSGSDISGMISGHRTFPIEQPNQAGAVDTQTITVDELLKTLNK